MKKDKLKSIIRERIGDSKSNTGYFGFDMSGFEKSNYENMNLILMFHDLLGKNKDHGCYNFVYPVFWKGSGRVMCVNNLGEVVKNIDVTGSSTQQILYYIITIQNPGILDE